MKNIVVTYFEPFGGRNTNASKEVVSLLKKYKTKELPVSWSKIPALIDDILSTKVDYLFLVGEAGSYKEISLEKYARNIAHGIDNSGLSKENELCCGHKTRKLCLYAIVFSNSLILLSRVSLMPAGCSCISFSMKWS